ncbi:MAG: coenzyme F420-0:L-glutamate ligase [Hydrogenophilaceae bacterium]|nr:coenzyme F420-0:L-glutamate ligase [Hydrogenophilaceae bacterium]
MTGRAKNAEAARGVSVHAVEGLPLLGPGDDLPALLLGALGKNGFTLQDGDVLVVAQKAVSKVEGRQVRLADVVVSAQSRAIAPEADKPAEIVELIRGESDELMRVRPGVIIARHKSGVVAANAGIDASNVAPPEAETVLLWPKDPDASARRIREAVQWGAGVRIAVIISDSLGRAWRLGTTGAAIGVAGMKPLRDRCGETDLYGRTLQATIVAVADEIAAAASLVMGEAAEGVPAAIVRGARYEPCEESDLRALLRPREEDLFP